MFFNSRGHQGRPDKQRPSRPSKDRRSDERVKPSHGERSLSRNKSSPRVRSFGVPAARSSRSQNQLLAQADPTAIFHDDCASCHVTPGIGLEGMPLYDAVCGICHDSEHRAEMVPSLTDKIGTADQGYWRHWITKGRDGSLMPGFSDSVDGPLTASQIESLVGALSKE